MTSDPQPSPAATRHAARTLTLTAGALLVPWLAAGASAGEAMSEDDYFTELPVVLSVTRLAQPLSETPGAVTVIDRATIRRSGARELAEIMRLVPGFLVYNYEGAARPVASYHAEYDNIPRHLQVFIDGRSVYSSLLVGTATYGMLGLVLEDIERIEVLRGSNSAAYGANAFLGVVNIVTRHPQDTLGGMLSLAAGETRLADLTARAGWGDERAVWRLSFSSRNDDGYAAVNDDKRLQQFHLRGDLRTATSDDLQMLAGHAKMTYGSHFGTQTLDQLWRNSYLRGQWTRELPGGGQIKLAATADEERYENFWPRLRADGTSRRLIVDAQHISQPRQDLRFVWGGEYRHEEADSSYLFASTQRERLNMGRLFANAEWRPHRDWIVNAGGLIEHHSLVGTSSAPRLMVNWHTQPGHTLRAGVTRAHKQPTLFELRADWRDAAGVRQFLASGQAQPETVRVREIGYLGDLRALGLTVDLRLFEEEVRDLLRYAAPCRGCPNDIVNKDPNTQRGWETQWRWQAGPDTQLLFNYTRLKLRPHAESTTPQDAMRAPRYVATLALFQRLPNEWDFSLIHSQRAEFFTVRLADMIPAMKQTDLRLARAFRLGGLRAEAALLVRAAFGGHLDYVMRGLPANYLDRRVSGTLQLEF